MIFVTIIVKITRNYQFFCEIILFINEGKNKGVFFMNVNFSQYASKVKNGYQNVVGKGKEFYTGQIKPAVSDGIKYTKELARDTVDFVKKNPKKAGKYVAVAGLAISGIALIAAGIKNAIKAHKQNKILTQAFVTQRETINDLKEIADTQQDIIAAKDRVIDHLKNS